MVVATATWVLTSASLSWTVSNAAVWALGLTFEPGLPTLAVRWAPFVLPLLVAPLTTIPRVRLQARLRETNEQLREEIRQRAELQAELEYQSTHDPLTGVLNRRGFFTAARVVGDGDAVLVVIDLDRFKAINDDHGHAVGDQVLQGVAQVLTQESEASDALVGRLGGDEFVVLLPGGQLTAAERIGAHLLALPVPLPDHDPLTVSASVGIVPIGEHRGIDDALADGDARMYAHKRRAVPVDGPCWVARRFAVGSSPAPGG